MFDTFRDLNCSCELLNDFFVAVISENIGLTIMSLCGVNLSISMDGVSLHETFVVCG